MSDVQSRERSPETASGAQREPDERVREALAHADNGGAPVGDNLRALTTLAAEVRRLQAAQREPAGEVIAAGEVIRHEGYAAESFIVRLRHPLPVGTKLYTQAQRDDHPPAATLDCICGKQANVRCLVHGPDSLDAQFFMHARQTWGDKADENELQEARFNFAAGYNAGLKALGLVRQHPPAGLPK